LLTAEGTEDDSVVVLGEIAHIVAESPDGPRSKSPMTATQRNSYPNLILLCNQHHQLIDSEEALATYTVERLTAMKQDHEAGIERTLRGRRNVADDLPPMVQDTVYSNLLPVRQIPLHIYGAPCTAAREADVQPKGAPESIMTPFIIRSGWLWAFQDLRDEEGPFAHAVTTAEAEEHLTAEWYAEPDRLGWYIALLNRYTSDGALPSRSRACSTMTCSRRCSSGATSWAPLPGSRARERSSPASPRQRRLRTRPGPSPRTQPRCGPTLPGRRNPPPGPGIRAAVAVLAPACRACQKQVHGCCRPRETLSIAPKRVRTEVPSGLALRTPAAASTATRKRIATVPRVPGRQPECLGRQRHRPHHTSGVYQQVALSVTASL
jgi:hypothetical protein